VEKYVIANLAGITAQKKFNPRSVRRYHASIDYENAIDLLSRYASSDEVLNAHIRYLEALTRTFVKQFWSQIEEVAAELLRRKRLTGPEIVSMFSQSLWSVQQPNLHSRPRRPFTR
jgi:hypothetical protein